MSRKPFLIAAVSGILMPDAQFEIVSNGDRLENYALKITYRKIKSSRRKTQRDDDRSG
jgi:hypothetical protein